MEELPDVRQVQVHLRSLGYSDERIIAELESVIVQQIQSGGALWDKIKSLLDKKH